MLIQEIKDNVGDDRNLCNICYEPMGGYLEIDVCKHQFCSECVEAYLDNLISTRQITKLVCPQHGCGN